MQAVAAPLQAPGPRVRRWTRAEYYRMEELGWFHDQRVELIDGEIIQMSPIGSRHAACVAFLSMLLTRLYGDRNIIYTQNPIWLSDFPQPPSRLPRACRQPAGAG